jgi:hypothetical protein
MTMNAPVPDPPVLRDVPIGIAAAGTRRETDSMGGIAVPAARYWSTLLVAALCLTAAEAQAQADRTGTGGGPLSTETAPNTTATGVTMPPDRAASPTATEHPGQRTREERAMDRIDDSICTGCDPK